MGLSGCGSVRLLQQFNHVLLNRNNVWPAVCLDAVLQMLGGHIASKLLSALP